MIEWALIETAATGTAAIERAAVEYAMNCAWQIPVLAAGAWLMVKIVRPQVSAQHWLWVSVLAMSVLLPLRGIEVQLAARYDAGAEIMQPVMIDVGTAQLERPNLAGNMAAGNMKAGVVDAPVKRWRWHFLRNGKVRLSVAATHWLASFYAAAAAFFGLRFALAWLSAQRLVKDSGAAVLPPETMREIERYAEKIGVTLPILRESTRIAGPAIVGCAKPVLLLPERFCDHAEEEIKAALCHELAHIKRRDYLMNLVCEVAALPVAWHPATFAIQQRIRRTREMVCDAMAAEEMESSAGYARCLVSLAQQMLHEDGMVNRTQAMGLFDNNTIEERVMGLTETKTAMSVWAKAIRVVSGAAAMAAVTMTAAAFHVRPAFAEPMVLAQNAPVAAAQAKPSAQVVEPKTASEVAKHDDEPTVIARGKHATVTAQKGDHVHRWTTADGEPFTMVNQSPKEPTEEEKHRVEAQLKEPLEIDLAPELLIDPKITLRMDALQTNLGNAEMKKQFDKANKMMNNPAFKKQMADLQKRMPEITAQANLAAADALKSNLDLQIQLDDLKNIQPNIDWKKFDIEHGAFDGEKFKLQMDSRMKGANEQMAKAQKEFESGEMKRKLEAAEQMLQDVKRQMEKMQAK